MNKFIKRIMFFLLVLMLAFFSFVIMPNEASEGYTYNFNNSSMIDDTSAVGGFGVVAENIVENVGVVIKTVGYALTVVMMLVLGIKYMKASPTEKAEVKKSAVIYFIGACVIFGATNIITAIISFANKNIV